MKSTVEWTIDMLMLAAQMVFTLTGMCCVWFMWKMRKRFSISLRCVAMYVARERQDRGGGGERRETKARHPLVTSYTPARSERSSFHENQRIRRISLDNDSRLHT